MQRHHQFMQELLEDEQFVFGKLSVNRLNLRFDPWTELIGLFMGENCDP